MLLFPSLPGFIKKGEVVVCDENSLISKLTCLFRGKVAPSQGALLSSVEIGLFISQEKGGI